MDPKERGRDRNLLDSGGRRCQRRAAQTAASSHGVQYRPSCLSLEQVARYRSHVTWGLWNSGPLCLLAFLGAGMPSMALSTKGIAGPGVFRPCPRNHPFEMGGGQMGVVRFCVRLL